MGNIKVKFLFTSLIALLLFSNNTFSQDSIMVPKPKMNKAQFRENFTQGNLMMLENFNDTALHTFLALHDADPSNANVNFKIGQLYLKTTSEKSKAVSYLEAAVSNASRKYVPNDPSEQRCPELVYKLLGEAYHLTYRFEEAISMFEKFKSCVNMNNVDVANDLNRRIEMCKTAKILVNAPVKCIITNLGDSINTNAPEYGAVITADESEMYFTSRRFNPETGGNDNRDLYNNYYEDIWVSHKKDNNTWSEAKPLSTHINTWYNEAVTGISADGQQLFFYKNDKGGSIFTSKLDGDQWSYATMIGSGPGDITDINSPYFEPSACLSADGNTLYFVSNRPGGYGGRDIYRCIKLPTGKWSKATNLGPSINTKYDEDAPFIHPDGVTLFFSSNGHNTMGGFDIFFSSRGDSGWAAPQNIGYPINTTDDDIYYVMSTDGKRAYFSSVRQEGKGDKDIYMVTIPKAIVVPVTLLKGYITFSGKDSLMSYTTISAVDIETGETIQEVHPNTRTRKYIIPLNSGRNDKKYTLTYQADGYRPHSETIIVSPQGEYTEVNKNFDFKALGSISVYGKITKRDSTPISSVKISVKDNVTKRLIGVYGSKSNGTYSFDLSGKGGENYSLTYEADGYLTINEPLDLPQHLKEYDFKKDVIMEASAMLGTISVKGRITNKENLPVKNATIIVTDNESGQIMGSYLSDNTGNYYLNFPKGANYDIAYQADGYLFQSVNINLPKAKSFSEITKDIVLDKISKGAKVVLNNIFFDSGKSTLRKESNVELDRLYKFLSEQKKLQVEVGGHTDNKGKPATNLKLSQLRAEAVVKYLINKGISKDRLVAKGYGDTEPIAPNTIKGKPNKMGMQQNRRVEFKILDN